MDFRKLSLDGFELQRKRRGVLYHSTVSYWSDEFHSLIGTTVNKGRGKDYRYSVSGSEWYVSKKHDLFNPLFSFVRGE